MEIKSAHECKKTFLVITIKNRPLTENNKKKFKNRPAVHTILLQHTSKVVYLYAVCVFGSTTWTEIRSAAGLRPNSKR